MAVGKATSMIDAVERVTGGIRYTASMQMEDMLVGRVFRSTMPHARILSIDTSTAESIEGVVGIVTRNDFGEGGMQPLYGSGQDQHVVAMEKTRFIGEPIALIAAETPEAAEAALYAIDVEYEELEPVFDPFEAIKEGAPQLYDDRPGNLLNHAKMRSGDLEAAFASADEIIEETYTSPIAQQTALEPQVAIAQRDGDSLTMWTASQSPYTVQRNLAQILEIDPNAIRIIVPPLGGGFGGKGNVRTQPQVAALAWKVNGRPVKMVNTRDEEFVTVTKHEVTITIKTGVKRDGTFTGRQITLHWNAGAFASSSRHLVPAGMLRSIGPYRFDAVRVDAYGIYTNIPTAAAYRGAMSSQACWAHESHLDTIAERIGMDPLELRLKNLLKEGEQFATGEKIHDAYFAECIQEAARGIKWGEPFDKTPAPHLRRGRGMAVMMKHTIATSQSECFIEMDTDGRVKLLTTTVEMGQGTHTALVQILSEEMGIPIDRIDLIGPDTAITPFDSQTASSRGVFMMGTAVIHGAQAFKEQISKLASEQLGMPEDALEIKNGQVIHAGKATPFEAIIKAGGLESLRAEGSHATTGGVDPETGLGKATPHWHQGAGACEVEIDIETGKLTILHYHAAALAGRVVNPPMADLQNDGNVIYGLGATLMEEVSLDAGQILNPNMSDYLIPSIQDIPLILTSKSIESESGELHGLGEMTLPPVSPAVGNAITDALGIRITDLPLTPERIFRALHDNQGEDQA